MPSPPDVELDPNIQAFAIIDDRLSNIEENQALFKEALQLEEMRRIGPLNKRLLGFPFNLDRQADSSEKSSTLTPFPEAVIVTVVPKCDYETAPTHYDCCCFSNTAPERKMLSDVELHGYLPRVKADDCEPEQCHQTRNHAVDSVHNSLCDEALERLYVKETLDSGPQAKKFSRVYGLVRTLDEQTIALCADMPSRTSVTDYIAQAVRLFCLTGHQLSCVSSVYVKDCSFYAVVLHRNLMQLNKMPDNDRRDFETSNCTLLLRCSGILESLRENRYFKMCKDRYPPFAIELLGW